jgi:antitoxin VapB
MAPLFCGQSRLGYTLAYPGFWWDAMHKTAKLFMNNRSQAVRLPKDFQFKAKEVYIRRVGDKVVLSPRPENWTEYLENQVVASPEFMENVEDLPLQERDIF